VAGPVLLAVSSGKGGVGKSTVSLNLALALAAEGTPTGLLDADIYGPDIPLMVGITRRAPTKGVTIWRDPKHGRGIEPLERFGIKIMSTQFLIAENQALSWSAPLVELLLQRFTDDVAWGDIDVLVIDLPPGTADIQQQLSRRLLLAGALIVVTPQDAAHLDAKKVLTMFDQSSVPVIGGVENMSGLVCPCCGNHIQVFDPVAHERSIWTAGVDRLVQIPIHRAIGGDAGRPLLVEHPESAEAEAFRTLARRLQAWAGEELSHG
jgi:ATP-binding protein involved in chromosome partitioning